jgi:Tfp pilus assembly protein PilF
MSDSDWYRNSEWTHEVSAAFEKRLSRTRGQRGEYLRIQALTLADTLKPEYATSAIGLARRHLELSPKGISAAQMHAKIARAFETLGEVSSAVDAYRSAVELEYQRPNVRGRHYIDFAWFVAVHELIANYDEALLAIEKNMQDSDLVFPVEQYRYFASLALISASLGDGSTAKRMAKNALESAAKEKGPFWRFPQLGLVKDETDAIRTRLKRLVG